MKIYECDQPSPEWHDLRRGRPTASEFKRIITPAKAEYSKGASGYIDQLIGDIYSPYYRQRAESYTSRQQQWGHDYEEEARRWFTMETGLTLRKVGFITTDDGRFGCSPDALVLGPDGEVVAGAEIKCPYEPEIQIARIREGVFPDEFRPQVHGGLWISGLPKWYFLSYAELGDCGQLLKIVEPDDYTVKLAGALEKFWGEFQKALKRIRGEVA